MAKKKPQELDDFQQFVVANYAEGEFSYCKTMEDVEDCGDTLCCFLVREISASEGCDSDDEAIRRLEVARDQIQDLVGLFYGR